MTDIPDNDITDDNVMPGAKPRQQCEYVFPEGHIYAGKRCKLRAITDETLCGKHKPGHVGLRRTNVLKQLQKQAIAQALDSEDESTQLAALVSSATETARAHVVGMRYMDMPGTLAESVSMLFSDPTLFNLQSEVALVTAEIQELVTSSVVYPDSAAWDKLRRYIVELKEVVREGGEDTIRMITLASKITRSHDEIVARYNFVTHQRKIELIDLKARLTTAAHNHAKLLRELVEGGRVEEMFSFLTEVLNEIVLRHVGEAIAKEIRAELSEALERYLTEKMRK